MILNDYELMNIDGGAIKTIVTISFLIGGLVALITGIFDGYSNPIKCRK